MRAISQHYELRRVTFEAEVHRLAVVVVGMVIILLMSYRASSALFDHAMGRG